VAKPESQVLELLLEPPLEHGPFLVQTAPQIRHRNSYAGPWSDTVSTSDADYRDTNRWLNQLQEARAGERRLLGEVRHDGVPMWQFLPSYVWPDVFWAIELVKALDSLPDLERTSCLRPHRAPGPLDALWQGVVEAFAEGRGLAVARLEPMKRPQLSLPRRVAGLARLGHARAAAVRWGSAAAAHALASLSPAPTASGRRLLLLSIPRHWGPPPDGGGEKADEQFGPLLGALRSRGWQHIVGVECPYGAPRQVLRSVADRMRHDRSGVRWRSFDAYGCLRPRSDRGLARTFGEQWRGLAPELMRCPEGRFRDVQLVAGLAETFERAFSATLPECAAMRRTARVILEREHPDAVIASYETGPYQRAVIVEAGSMGIPTVGLMHGMIFDNHYDYMHTGTGVDPLAPGTVFAIPARTCVWGPTWKRSLTESGHYPPEAVAVTGHWRYDRLTPVREQEDRVDGRQRVTILTAAQETPLFLRAVLAILSEDARLVPTIRLHPSEDPQPVSELLDELGLPREVLADRGSLAVLIRGSDVVVAQHSTVVSEAIMLGVPTVVVDLLRRGGWAAHAESEACITARTPAELARALKLALDDEPTCAALRAAAAGYVADHFLALDGRAAQRVAAEVTGLVDTTTVRTAADTRR